MGNSQNGNSKGKGKADTYQQWTMDNSNMLLGLLDEAMKNGLRDTNGCLSKLNVENFILPRLNMKIRFPKTYSNYLSQMKWFKNQYNKINELMRSNFGFGWDPIGMKVTASDEVWEEYLKIGIGGVLRDHDSRILCLFSNNVGARDVVTAKVITTTKAIDHCVSNPGVADKDITFITDSKEVASWINRDGFDSSNHVQRVFDIRHNLCLLDQARVIFNSSASTTVTNSLAKFGSVSCMCCFLVGCLFKHQ
ncbi:hypothetical protein QYF36_025909 [Acer negundo]|nr:hypothetical protein QYF36_025909 [Acer negundo]